MDVKGCVRSWLFLVEVLQVLIYGFDTFKSKGSTPIGGHSYTPGPTPVTDQLVQPQPGQGSCARDAGRRQGRPTGRKCDSNMSGGKRRASLRSQNRLRALFLKRTTCALYHASAHWLPQRRSGGRPLENRRCRHRVQRRHRIPGAGCGGP